MSNHLTMKSATSLAALLALTAVPAVAQQTQAGGTGGGNQTLEQEAAVSAGTGLYVSPSDVRRVQQALNNAGYEAGAVDGQVAEGTITALCNYQQANGLEPTGNFNPDTLMTLGLSDIVSGSTSQEGAETGVDQTWTQETARAQGSPLFASPATVRQIEQALNNAGYDAGNIDGIYDDSFRTALTNYQQAQGMEPTGTVTVQTVNALNVQFQQGGQGGSDQTLAQEQSAISPEQCVAMGQQSIQAAMSGGGQQAGGQQAGGQQGGGQQAGAEQAGGQQAGGEQQAGGQQAGGEQQAGGQQAGGQDQSASPGGQLAQGQGAQVAQQGGTQLFLSPASVRQIEQALNAAGYDVGNVDGEWGETEMQSLANYQQAHNLEPTGNLNTRVIAALNVEIEKLNAQGGGGTSD